MGEGYKRLLPVAAIAFVVVAASFRGAVGADCGDPADSGYAVEFPQGDQADIKLYESDKGGRLGTVMPQQIVSVVTLCAGKVGKVNPIQLPPGTAVQFEAGKAAPNDNIYWVRDTQVRFTQGSQAELQKFICERNQVKTRSAGGAAGNEACEQP
ncbi:hypothetical protein [Pelagibius sp. 7325]|uniref:hypothetical protein n=1 Tax=Pelagibius sp. 7325 TaxID=3131994 RepID=UPI0030EDBAFC